MMQVEVTPRQIPSKELVKKAPLETDATQIVSEPTIFTREGKVIMVYGKYPHSVEGVREACKTIKYEKGNRTTGLKSESRIFGFKPRLAIRADYCSSTMMCKDYPDQHEKIASLGFEFTRIYERYAPEVYRHHKERLDTEVLPEWRIPGTIFTSGIVNKSNPLKYHFDTGNFKDCMSCMLVMRKDIEGGMLSLPEFNIKLDLQDSTYLLFDGQSILHGVTPIIPRNKLSYRYSIVFYALQQMNKCLPFDEELKRVRMTKRLREEKRLLKERPDLCISKSKD